MGYYSDVQKNYKPSMDSSRFASAGPSPVGGGFSEPAGMFSEQSGTFSTPKGTFMPDGSMQQDKAIALGLKRGMPTALNPDTPVIKSTYAPLGIGQPFMYKNRLIGGDLSLSPFLDDPAFSIEKLRGGMGML